ncbi:galactose oxidase early set domain-containing protein [Ideonella livida]|uniref:DUF1929 domain-containing protein n=1 Tax=Ideonella livida TaxID=2707176 RepID=A0A7C9PHN5_9BURK|nr:galactose oxidase early set domain-containing protein [Ideonella livida]NDY92233.1 DUF1929 domain-containing protein [Ideonella livida]
MNSSTPRMPPPPRRRWLQRIAGLTTLWAGLGWTRPAPAAVPVGPSDAHLRGHVGPVFATPVMPIHSQLLPDGRVMAFGTDDRGRQGAALQYMVWDPALGTGAEAMSLLLHTTGTDIFCAGQALTPQGQLLMFGGDRIYAGLRNYANREVTQFDPQTRSFSTLSPSMHRQRWYATALSGAQGHIVVLGGRDDREYAGDPEFPATAATYAETPEVREEDGRWRLLTGAGRTAAFVKSGGWYYPRAFLLAGGDLLIVTPAGALFRLDTEGLGHLATLSGSLPPGSSLLPSAAWAPGRVLSLRADGSAWTVDARRSTPTIAATTSPGGLRTYGHLTTLPNGQLWLNGGSTRGNTLEGAHLEGALWTPATGQWQATAAARHARLYHASSLLLPDGSVLTGGGGAPGPQTLLNAEIWYPPYLFRRDGSGRPARRPVLRSVPAVLQRGQTGVGLVLGDDTVIAQVVLMRLGGSTHNFNASQHRVPLGFRQQGVTLQVDLPSAAGVLPPGHYSLFVLDKHDVPSLAPTVRVL